MTQKAEQPVDVSAGFGFPSRLSAGVVGHPSRVAVDPVQSWRGANASVSPPTLRVSTPGLPYGSGHIPSQFQKSPNEDRVVWVKVDGVMRKARVNESGGKEVVDQSLHR